MSKIIGHILQVCVIAFLAIWMLMLEIMLPRENITILHSNEPEANLNAMRSSKPCRKRDPAVRR